LTRQCLLVKAWGYREFQGVSMSAVPTTHSTKDAQDEQATVEQILARVRARFPDVPGEEVDRVVRARYADFHEARIRDFVPIFVEREARAALAGSLQH
jgi:hypothetical protein